MSNRICFPGRVPIRRILPEARGTDQDLKVSSCCCDAEQCQPGDIYVAIDDGVTDGHDLAYDAIDRGAVGLVVERFLPVEVPQYLVEDTRVAFGRMCHVLAGSPSSQLCSIGITGTYGKTVTELLTIAMLEAAGHQVGAIGSLGICDGFETHDCTASKTSSETIEWLARMRDRGCSHAVIEASSEMLATKGLSGIELDAAMVTNIRRSHLDFHGSVANYRRAKSAIFDHLKTHGTAILNADDPGCKHIVSTFNGPVLTYSLKHEAEVTATLVERVTSEQTFLIHVRTDSMPIRTAIVGDPHIQNCLAVACLGVFLGIELPVIARGLEMVESVPARMERVECGQGFNVFVDCGMTAESLASTMSTLREFTRGRLICVAASPADLPSVERARLGHVLERFADEVALTSSDLATEAESDVIHDMLDGFERPAQARWFPSRTKSICWSLEHADPGDTVLIAGGAPSRKSANARWNDHDIAKYWLMNVGEKKVSRRVAA